MAGSRWKDDELFKRLEAAMRRAEAGRKGAPVPVAPTDVDGQEALKLSRAENQSLRQALARAEADLAESRKSVINLMVKLASERRRWRAAMVAVRRRLNLARRKRAKT